jgi:hypothetical protein
MPNVPTTKRLNILKICLAILVGSGTALFVAQALLLLKAV